MTADRRSLRMELRQRRRQLTPAEQADAAVNLALNLLTHPALLPCRHIAIYLPNDGEISPLPFAQMIKKRGVQLYLPVLHPVFRGRLAFCPFNDTTPLVPNRFGIPEPEFHHRQFRPSWSLDAVLFPLVGFDENGERLGMGGGFYDRTFSYARLRPAMAPKLFGLAHECQKVDALPTQSWDIPLDGVITDWNRY